MNTKFAARVCRLSSRNDKFQWKTFARNAKLTVQLLASGMFVNERTKQQHWNKKAENGTTEIKK